MAQPGKSSVEISLEAKDAASGIIKGLIAQIEALHARLGETSASFQRASVMMGGATSKLEQVSAMMSQLKTSTQKVGEATASATSQFEGMRASLGRVGAALSLTAAIGAVAGGLTKVASAGIEFNRTMEDTRGGIAALILSTRDLSGAAGGVASEQVALSKSFQLAEAVQQDLVEAAKQTKASYTDLVTAFQAAYGPAVAAGITNVGKLQQVVVGASQAVAALGLDSRQTTQEIRALFTGEQGPDNTLNRVLRITKEEMEKVKASGQDLGDWMLQKLSPFMSVAAQNTMTFSVATSNLRDAFEQFAGTVSRPIFEALSTAALDAQTRIKQFGPELSEIGRSAAALVPMLVPLVEAFVKLALAGAKVFFEFAGDLAKLTGILTSFISLLTRLVDGWGGAVVAGYAVIKLYGLMTSGATAVLGATKALSAFLAADFVAVIGTASKALATFSATMTASVGVVGGLAAAIAALVAGLVLLGFWLKKNSEEKQADAAWRRAAEGVEDYRQKIIAMTGVQIDTADAQKLLTMRLEERNKVLNRMTDAQVNATDAQRQLLEEELKAAQAVDSLAEKMKKAGRAFTEWKADIEGRIRIDKLQGIPKLFAEMAEGLAKAKREFEQQFRDADTGKWLISAEERQRGMALLEGEWYQKRLELLKKFRQEVEEIEAKPVDPEVYKALPPAVEQNALGMILRERHTLTVAPALGLAPTKEASVKAWTPFETAALDAFTRIREMVGSTSETIQRTLESAWAAAGRLFDDVFYGVMTGRLDDLGDAFKRFGDSIVQSLSAAFSDMAQAAILELVGIQKVMKDGKWTIETTGGGLLGGDGGTVKAVGNYAQAGAIGYGVGSAIGQFGNGSYNQTGAQIGGVVGGAAAIALGAEIGSIWPVVGTVIGAVVGLLVGVLASPNTEKHLEAQFSNALNGVGNELERAMKNVFDSATNTLTSIAKIAGGADAAREFRKTYLEALKKSLIGSFPSHVDIAAGSNEDIANTRAWFLQTLLPRQALQIGFGQVGIGMPSGNRDAAGGAAGFDWWRPGMDKDGNWIQKQLYDPNAPIPKMLAGLGFTSDKIKEIAQRVATDDPAKVLEYLKNVVGLVVGMNQLIAEMGRGRTEIWAQFENDAATSPVEAFAKSAAELKAEFEDLSLLTGDEQIAKAQELVGLAAKRYDEEISYLRQIWALSKEIGKSIDAQIQSAKEALMTPAEVQAARVKAANEAMSRLSVANNPEIIRGAVQDAQAAVNDILSALVERIKRGRALVESFTQLAKDFTDLPAKLAREAADAADPIGGIWRAVADIQAQAAAAAKLSGDEQLEAYEKMGQSAAETLKKIEDAIRQIDQASAALSASVRSQIDDLTTAGMTPSERRARAYSRISEAQAGLKTAKSPEEVARWTSQIQDAVRELANLLTRIDPQAFRDLAAQFAKSIEIVRGELADQKNPITAYLRDVAKLVEDYKALTGKSTEEQLEGIGKLRAAADELWKRQLELIRQILQAQSEMNRSVDDQVASLRNLGESRSDGLTRVMKAIQDGIKGISTAASPEDVAKATQNIQGLVNEYLQLVGQVDPVVFTDLAKAFRNMTADIEKARFNQENPLAFLTVEATALFQEIRDLQKLTAEEQIEALARIKDRAAAVYQVQIELLQKIAQNARSLSESVAAQKWEMQMTLQGPEGQVGMIEERIQSLYDRLSSAASPEEVQRITGEIQSLVGRYTGMFQEGDPKRAEAFAKAQEILDKMEQQAQERYSAMADRAKEIADRLAAALDEAGVTATEAFDEIKAKLILLLEEMRAAANLRWEQMLKELQAANAQVAGALTGGATSAEGLQAQLLQRWKGILTGMETEAKTRYEDFRQKLLEAGNAIKAAIEGAVWILQANVNAAAGAFGAWVAFLEAIKKASQSRLEGIADGIVEAGEGLRAEMERARELFTGLNSALSGGPASGGGGTGGNGPENQDPASGLRAVAEGSRSAASALNDLAEAARAFARNGGGGSEQPAVAKSGPDYASVRLLRRDKSVVMPRTGR